MANLQNTLSVAAVLLLLVGSAFAAQYMVGDADGWSYNVDLEAWAESKTFYVGDVIVFSYTQGDHNVVMVDEAGYNSCNTNSNLGVYTSGYDSFTLNSPGYVYFICGYHCDFADQKIAINILPSSP